MMERQWKQRSVLTIDLGFEQLQIITEADERVRVLFGGVWLGEPAESRTTFEPPRA